MDDAILLGKLESLRRCLLRITESVSETWPFTLIGKLTGIFFSASSRSVLKTSGSLPPSVVLVPIYKIWS